MVWVFRRELKKIGLKSWLIWPRIPLIWPQLGQIKIGETPKTMSWQIRRE
jgi:hypothetical protein